MGGGFIAEVSLERTWPPGARQYRSNQRRRFSRAVIPDAALSGWVWWLADGLLQSDTQRYLTCIQSGSDLNAVSPGMNFGVFQYLAEFANRLVC